jgi:hypothetical protein
MPAGATGFLRQAVSSLEIVDSDQMMSAGRCGVLLEYFGAAIRPITFYINLVLLIPDP